MPKRSSKKKLDINALAAQIVGEVTDEKLAETPHNPEKNPAAVELGRLGGLKGGVERAKKLTKDQRTLIAINAARARWRKK